jgi:DNA-binding response OmpR family regulator
MVVAPRSKQQDKSPELIWVLDNSAALEKSLNEILGRKYQLKFFRNLDAMKGALKSAAREHTGPVLIVTEGKLETDDVPVLLGDHTLTYPPVMVVSACNDFQVIASCLDLGAADYLLKPVDPNLLLAKIGALVKTIRKPNVRLSSGLRFDLFTHVVTNESGTSVKLTQKEFQLLCLLDKSYPDGVRPVELRKQIWGNLSVVSKALDVHLFKLRKKLGSLGLSVQFASGEIYVLAKLPVSLEG